MASARTPKRDKKALKHRHYAAEAIVRLREISGVVRAMKALAGTS
jgi:hypothetical protein